MEAGKRKRSERDSEDRLTKRKRKEEKEKEKEEIATDAEAAAAVAATATAAEDEDDKDQEVKIGETAAAAVEVVEEEEEENCRFLDLNATPEGEATWLPLSSITCMAHADPIDNEMIKVVLNDRLGKKVRVKCNDDDTIDDLKNLVAAQTGTQPNNIRIQSLDT
ncbi:hypothetical protein LWI29_038449 [Acer saccharum]|uniref:Ubiquitin-like domain-containing protein n=1 Tax=Acer saccharum TaxID=4024 RepID=A0AA39S0V4_ACESA|nr:hypothetical protein LWI29_038449 [Acer saccharum]